MILRKLQNLALLLFFFSLNFEVYDPLNTGGFFSVAKLSGFIYLATIIPQLSTFLRVDGYQRFLKPIWIFFFLLLAMSALNVNALFPQVFDRTVFQNIIIFWIIINHEREEPGILEKSFLGFALGSVVLSVLFYSGIGISYIDTRLSIFGDNQNVVGMRMCLSMVILIVNVVQNRLEMRMYRFLLLLPLPVMFHLMTATQSRVSLVSFVVALFVGVVLLKTRRVLGKMLVLSLGGAVFLILWFILESTDVIQIRIFQSIVEGDLSGREDIWEVILPLIKENLLFGVGRTGYNYFTQSTWGVVKSPHNVILEVIAFTGLVGLVFFLFFYIRVIVVSFRVYLNSGMLMPLLLMIPIFGLLLSGQLIDVKIFWGITAYVVSCLGNSTVSEEDAFDGIYLDDAEMETI